MARTIILIITLLILPCLSAKADKLEYCHDGDTCRIKTDQDVIKVRLSGIDAPEIKQPLGKDARDFMNNQLRGKNLKLECTGKSWDRKVCAIFADGSDVQEKIVRVGLAREYRQYSGGKYSTAEAYAKGNGLGIWGLKNKTSPYCSRKRNSKKQSCRANPAFQP